VLRLCAAFKKSLDKKNTSHYGTSYLISFTNHFPNYQGTLTSVCEGIFFKIFTHEN